MADKKPGRGGHGDKKKKGKKEPKPAEPSTGGRRSSYREKAATRRRMHDGKAVVPVKYSGSHAGHGGYMAGMVGDEIVRDDSGKPIAFHDFPLEPQVVRDF